MRFMFPFGDVPGVKLCPMLLRTTPLGAVPEVLVACISLEKHVIPGKAGIHRIPNQQWTPAFAGVTTLIFIASGRATGAWKVLGDSHPPPALRPSTRSHHSWICLDQPEDAVGVAFAQTRDDPLFEPRPMPRRR